MTEIKKIKFLWEASNTWSPKNHIGKVLKSYYLTTCRKLIKSEDDLPNLQFGEKAMCSRCSSCWHDANFSLKVMPNRSLKSKKSKEVKDAIKKQKPSRLYSRKVWVIKCNVCKHKTKFELKKPLKITKKKELRKEEDKNSQLSTITSTKPKKKKKKDKFAGLNLSGNKIPNTQKKLLISEDEKDVKSTPQPQILKKQSTKVKQPTKNPMQKPKLQSKTKQKNTLLQLAQLLKSNNSNKNTNTNDRLKNLLR